MPKIEAYDVRDPLAQPAPPNAKKTRRVLRKKPPEPKPYKKYAWLAGHGLTLVFGTIYAGFYSTKWFHSWYWIPLIAYRLAFIGVITSYSVTVLTTFGFNLPDYSTLFATENFQSLLLAGVWLLLRNSIFKLIPYHIIALLQLGSEFNVKPILNLETQLGDIIAVSEILVIFALLFDTLLFRGTSGFALVIYLSFYWLRVNFSPYTQYYILKIVHLIDEKIIVKQKPEIQAKWQKVKDFIEFRRVQNKEALERRNIELPETYKAKPPKGPSKDTSKSGKSIGTAQNFQAYGADPNKEKPNNEGVHVSSTSEASLYRADETKKAPAGLGKNDQQTHDKNFNAGFTGAISAASAGYSTGIKSVTARAGFESTFRKRQNEPIDNSSQDEQSQSHPISAAASQEESQTQSPVVKTTSNGHELVTPPTGHTSKPSPPKVSSYEKAGEIITQPQNNVQLVAQELNDKVDKDEYSKLKEIQQRARNEISQTQGNEF